MDGRSASGPHMDGRWAPKLRVGSLGWSLRGRRLTDRTWCSQDSNRVGGLPQLTGLFEADSWLLLPSSDQEERTTVSIPDDNT